MHFQIKVIKEHLELFNQTTTTKKHYICSSNNNIVEYKHQIIWLEILLNGKNLGDWLF